MFVVVVVLLVVKYTLEFADRTRWRRTDRGRRPRWLRRPPEGHVIEFAASAPASPAPVAETTGDPYWDLVTRRIADTRDD